MASVSDSKIALVGTKAFTYPFLLFEVANFCRASKLGKKSEETKAMNRDKKASHLESYALETHECSRGGEEVASIEAK